MAMRLPSGAKWCCVLASASVALNCTSTTVSSGGPGASEAGAAGNSGAEHAGQAGTAGASAGESAGSESVAGTENLANGGSEPDGGRAGEAGTENLANGGSEPVGGRTGQGGSTTRGGTTGQGGESGAGEAGVAGTPLGEEGGSGTGGAATGGDAGAGTVEECTVGDMRLCSEGGLFGTCASGTQSCRSDHTWTTCTIQPRAQDTCAEGNDDDCDGTPNGGCSCLLGEERSCAEAGLEGNCGLGVQLCDAQGTFGDCSVAAEAQDSCEPGDDANCNGIPNEGCHCLEGETQPCGSAPDRGLCRPGTSTCTDEVWSACEGEILPGPRDCSSSADNDCDGIADNTIDTVCQCAEGSTNPCDEHPGLDGVGICRAGAQPCVIATDGRSSVWGACEGSMGPSTEKCDTNNADEDCDGYANLQCKATSCTSASDLECQSILVPGGSFLMGRSLSGTDAFDSGNPGEIPEHSVTISPFYLDTYEVTVARFRQFLEAYTAGWAPEPDQGEHPRIPGSGWNSGFALSTPAELLEKVTSGYGTYSATSGMNDELPIINLDFTDAFAFCIWDGGRLPTDAEWEFAAAGGSENRLYPWGSATPGPLYASYGCGGNSDATDCALSDVIYVHAYESG